MRDLAWACFSPPLLHISHLTDAASGVSDYAPYLSHKRQQWLQQLDHRPEALLSHLSLRPTHRLGMYFEQLWHFFMQHAPGTRLVAHNLAVHEAGRTLGEFDCIYYDEQRNRHVHLELAVKFFLGLPRERDSNAAASAHEWRGPDRRDRLSTKLDQLLQRQIRLADTAAGKRRLQELGIPEPVREIALKGYLFQPLANAPPPPPGYNTACTMNYWIMLDQLATHCATLDTNAFIILPKMTWLGPARCASSEQVLGQYQLQQLLATQWASDPYPMLIAALDDNGAESSRFFVTPDNWPDIEHTEDVRERHAGT